MYSIKEVANILNFHWQTVRNMILRGEIKATKIGRQWRISEKEIQRLKGDKQ